jgi:hypothetical protein
LCRNAWWGSQDSNLQPSDYEPELSFRRRSSDHCSTATRLPVAVNPVSPRRILPPSPIFPILWAAWCCVPPATPMQLQRRRFLHFAAGAAATPAVSRIARARRPIPRDRCASSSWQSLGLQPARPAAKSVLHVLVRGHLSWLRSSRRYGRAA